MSLPDYGIFGYCRRGCPDGECYCSEPTMAESISTPNEEGMCTGCGGIGECLCGEE
jgi:hypothetical protein